MKNAIRKKEVRITFCSLLLAACSFFIACPEPLSGVSGARGGSGGGGGSSTLSITIGSSGSVSRAVSLAPADGAGGAGPASLADVSRAMLPWEDTTLDADNLEHTITISGGPGGDQKQAGIKTGQTVRFIVNPGTWEVTVQAYLGTLLIAEGTESVSVKSGENNPVSIKMSEASPVLTSIDDFVLWLGTKKDGKTYTVRLNIGDLNGGVAASGSLGSILSANPSKTFKLDLSGSTFPAIPNNAFSHLNNITGITIPNSVITIGHDAFEFCTSLTSVTIGNGVQSIEYEAFYNCTSLTGITIPNSVTSIGFSTFDSCTSLKSVTIGNGLDNIVEDAFYNCTSLESVTIGNSVTEIGNHAFNNCTSLASITIPKSVETILSFVFNNCTGLASVTFATGSNITTFGNNAFPEGTTGVGGDTLQIAYNAAITGNGNGAGTYTRAANGDTWTKPFTNMNEFREWLTQIGVNSPGSAYEVKLNISGLTDTAMSPGPGQALFNNPSKYVILDLSGSTYTGNIIQDNTFAGCANLVGITIPNSVDEIGSSAFNSCSSLTSISIPNSVSFIGSSAFSSCSNLASITLPASLNEIKDGCFFYCGSLTSITIPNSVQSIMQSAFANCTGLTSITIPNNVQTIMQNTFSNCIGLTSVTIGSGVQSIQLSAFQTCSGLTEVTFKGTIPAANFHVNAFDAAGDLRDAFYRSNTANGTPGKYTRPNTSTPTWTN